MMVWWASPVECGSAVHRLRREGAFTPTDAAQVLAGRADAVDAANVVQPGDELSARALRLLGVHPFRAARALQLAAALLWEREKPGGKDFVCLGERPRTAAILEGFSVLPSDHRVRQHPIPRTSIRACQTFALRLCCLGTPLGMVRLHTPRQESL